MYEFAISYPRPGRMDGYDLIVANGYHDAEQAAFQLFGVMPTGVNLLGAIAADIPSQRVSLTGLGWLVAEEVPS